MITVTFPSDPSVEGVVEVDGVMSAELAGPQTQIYGYDSSDFDGGYFAERQQLAIVKRRLLFTFDSATWSGEVRILKRKQDEEEKITLLEVCTIPKFGGEVETTGAYAMNEFVVEVDGQESAVGALFRIGVSDIVVERGWVYDLRANAAGLVCVEYLADKDGVILDDRLHMERGERLGADPSVVCRETRVGVTLFLGL